jgi:multidrug efflux system outer membrane protein
MRRIALVLPGLLAGCSLAPKLETPPLPVPASWPVGDAYLRTSEAALPSLSYRDIFRDARLQRLIEQALANNRDLRVAAANIAAARAQYRIQRAAQLPRVDASTGVNVRDFGRTGTLQPGGGGGAGGVPVQSNGGGARTTYTGNVGITGFEIDLFGRLASLSEAAQNRYFATEAGARATRLALVADIADAWLTHAADASLLRVAEQTAASAERSVALTQARLRGGIAPRTDLAQAVTILETARADVADQRTALAQDANLLQLLVGGPVDPASLAGAIEEVAPRIGELPAGLDSRILLRRPDVVEAEYQLRAANAEIGAARAALFPTISLTGLVGLASNALGSLFSGDAFTWSAGADVGYPIFRAGAGRAGVQLSQAQRDAALAAYERAIQTAFREVSDALARRGTIGEQLRANTARTAAAQDTFRLVEARYRGGIDSFLSSLDAQRSLYAAQRTLIAARLTGASNLVTLYRALGGDASLQQTPVVTPLPD